jgi:hypothetical protein
MPIARQAVTSTQTRPGARWFRPGAVTIPVRKLVSFRRSLSYAAFWPGDNQTAGRAVGLVSVGHSRRSSAVGTPSRTFARIYSWSHGVGGLSVTQPGEATGRLALPSVTRVGLPWPASLGRNRKNREKSRTSRQLRATFRRDERDRSRPAEPQRGCETADERPRKRRSCPRRDAYFAGDSEDFGLHF